MKTFAKLVEQAIGGGELCPADLPNIDLYMDQILTLFEEGLAGQKRSPDERVLTKTMINNYSKERLILPVKGKKYSRAQLMQLLCILALKQTLALGDIRALMQRCAPEQFEAACAESLARKQRLRARLPGLLDELLEGLSPDDPQQALTAALTLSGGADDLRRICEGLATPNKPI